MKKLFLSLVLVASAALTVMAADTESIDYKNIKDGASVCVSEDGTTWNSCKKSDKCFIKKISDGSGSYSEFYSPDGEFLFSTGCQYEFINKGSLIGYSNFDLKFYEFTIKDELLQQRELSSEEVQDLFKDYEIIKILEFSDSTNSLKIKKRHGNFKLILLNDTDRYFYHYGFTSNNAKFKTYPLKGFLSVSQKGMIQFSHFGDNTKENPWYILLVR